MIDEQKLLSANDLLLIDTLFSFYSVFCSLFFTVINKIKHCEQLINECLTLGAVSLHWGKLVMKICRLNNDGGGDHDGGGE